MNDISRKISPVSVLVSTGIHPISGTVRYCRNDAIALSMGLSLADAQQVPIKVLHAGKPNNIALNEYLALGATCIETVADDNAVNNLAVQLNDSNLILTGSRAETGECSGLLPYLLAHQLEIPIVANALKINIVPEGVEVLQFLPKGKRRRVCVSLPAIVAIHPFATANLHFSYARISSGKINVLSKNTLVNTLKIDVVKNPIKLKENHESYAPKKSGHERMTDALATKSKDGIVVIEQSYVEKSQVILSYLREHHLIDF